MASDRLATIRRLVADGKSNLSIALSLNMSIKGVILAVKELEAADERDEHKFGVSYIPIGLPDRKHKAWTTGEVSAVLAAETSGKSMAKSLGRTAGSIRAQRSLQKRKQREDAHVE